LYRFSDVSVQQADGSVHPLRRTGLGFSSSAANLTDGVCETQLIPNFQRVTICGEDASEVSTAYSIYVLKASQITHLSVVLCDSSSL